MSELVDKNGKEINTSPHENASGLPAGETGEQEEQPKERAAEFIVEKGYFVVKLPILNNLYQTLSALLWAEDRIRGIYAKAQMDRAEKEKGTLLSPVNKMMKNFGNKWKVH